MDPEDTFVNSLAKDNNSMLGSKKKQYKAKLIRKINKMIEEIENDMSTYGNTKFDVLQEVKAKLKLK